MIAQAFVLGAGLGTRLRPLTDELPKPLVPIFQKPLLTFAFDHLAAAGVKSFVVNTHHLPGAFTEVFAGGRYGQLPVQLVHEPILLETGGGMKNAQPFLGTNPFLVYSGDVLTDLPLEPLITEHLRRGNDVTLALRETGLARHVAFRDGRVVGIGDRSKVPGDYDYANVSVWNAGIFGRISLGEKVSFIPILAEWIEQGGQIGGVVLNEGEWFNLGSPAQYLDAHRTIAERSWRPAYVQPPAWPVRIDPTAVVEPGAEIQGCSAVGPGCRISAGAVVRDSVLWPGAQIAPRARLNRCIVRAHRAVEGAQTDDIL